MTEDSKKITPEKQKDFVQLHDEAVMREMLKNPQRLVQLPSDHNAHIHAVPRQFGKVSAGTHNPQTTVMRNPGDRSFTIMGMKISEEEFYNVHHSLGSDETSTVEHFKLQAMKQQKLSRYFGGNQQRHGSSPFNPKLNPGRSGRGLLMDRFLSMSNAEREVIELLAEKMRDTYMPHHSGQQMDPWAEMDQDRQVKWIEMAVVAVRELDKLGLMR